MKRSLVVTLLLGLLLMACSESNLTGPAPMPPESAMSLLSKVAADAGQLTVMTRNIYVGTNLDIILAAQDPNDIPILAAEAFQTLLATNFYERADALADEIQARKPHLIGLQEVTTIRIQSPGDMVLGGTAPATTVVFDYLEILQDALSRQGLHYDVIATVQNFDVEVPMIVSVDPLAFDDVRATDFNVILARHDVRTSNVVSAKFQAELPLEDLGLSIPNGFTAADAIVNNRVYRFVNTHLESYSEVVRMAQAEELASILAGENKPVVLVGDFNSTAPNGSAYHYMLSQGYRDAWISNQVGNQGDGNTSLMAADLRNTAPTLFERIDFIFVRTSGSDIGPVQAWVVGNDPKDRTASGLWPSDHAGVVAQLHLPE